MRRAGERPAKDGRAGVDLGQRSIDRDVHSGLDLYTRMRRADKRPDGRAGAELIADRVCSYDRASLEP